MNPFSKLQRLWAKKTEYSAEDQTLLSSWMKLASDLEHLDEIARSESWKLLESRIKEELKLIITNMITDDKSERGGRIAAFLQILSTLNTKQQKDNLEAAINDVIEHS